MPPQRCLPSPGPTWMMVLGTVGSRAAHSVGVGRAIPARILPGPLGLPRQGSCRGSLLRPSAPCGLGLGVALIILGFGLTLAHLPVLLGVTVGAAPTARAQVKGYKSVPLFLYTDNMVDNSGEGGGK